MKCVLIMTINEMYITILLSIMKCVLVLIMAVCAQPNELRYTGRVVSVLRRRKRFFKYYI